MATETTDDCYALLGIAPDAGDEEVRRAWRRLVHQWHPDRAGPGTTLFFQKLSAAYAVLSDPEARAAYDRRRAVRPAAADAPPRRAPGVMLSRVSAPLGALLARGVAREAEDGVIELFLERQEVEEGGMVTISMRVPVHCPDCARDATVASCPRCEGARTVEDLFSAWLAVRPGVADGTLLNPSAQLPNVVRPVTFRVRLP